MSKAAGSLRGPLMEALSPRQRSFVLGLIAGKSQTQAYRDAGYVTSAPEVNASRLMRNAKVRSAFREAAAIVQSGAVADAVERQEFWTSVMRDPNIHLRDRLKASELLGRAGGDFIERIEADTSIRVEFTMDRHSFAGGDYQPPDPYAGVVGLPGGARSDHAGEGG